VMSLCGKPTCGWKDCITVYVAEWENMDVVHYNNQCWDLANNVVAWHAINSYSNLLIFNFCSEKVEHRTAKHLEHG